jgi:hypothetical protein
MIGQITKRVGTKKHGCSVLNPLSSAIGINKQTNFYLFLFVFSQINHFYIVLTFTQVTKKRIVVFYANFGNESHE